jgi:LPXTG-site transpeptidase (sortase) family protein
MLKRIIKILLVLSLFILFIPTYNKYKIEKRVDEILLSKENSIYEGYIYIPKFNYKNVIKKGDKAINENLVSMHNLSDPIGSDNIILSGHNNKYVFHKLYKLDIGDEIIIGDFKKDYRYTVDNIKVVNIDDSYVFNKEGLKLITCTNDNQKRLVVFCTKK